MKWMPYWCLLSDLYLMTCEVHRGHLSLFINKHCVPVYVYCTRYQTQFSVALYP